MKNFFLLLMCFICLMSCAFGESSATPTDLTENELVEIEDNDYGQIEPILIERKVYISPSYENDKVVFTAVLVDFQPNDVVTFTWQYTEDKQSDWITINNETQQVYSFIPDAVNSTYFYRVVVEWEELV